MSNTPECGTVVVRRDLVVLERMRTYGNRPDDDFRDRVQALRDAHDYVDRCRRMYDPSYQWSVTAYRDDEEKLADDCVRDLTDIAMGTFPVRKGHDGISAMSALRGRGA